MKKVLVLSFLIFGTFLYILHSNTFSSVIQEGDRTYLIDRTGERWDITQAMSIGFQPERFQYGLGRDAFTPLDDSFLSDVTGDVPSNMRILGVSEGEDARAYSISKLTGHEIANSAIGSKPIAVGY